MLPEVASEGGFATKPEAERKARHLRLEIEEEAKRRGETLEGIF
jgi:hypothetical protein